MEDLQVKQLRDLLHEDILKQYAKLYYEKNKEHIRIQNAIYSRNFYRRRQDKPVFKIENRKVLVSFD